MSYKKMPSEFY